MVKPLSGVVMGDLIANGKATPSQLEQVKENNRNNFNIWQKEHNAKQEYKRGMAIEFEKEKRVQAGLPEYDVQQQTTNQTSTTNPINEQQSGNVKKSKKQLRHEYELEKAKKYREKQQAKAENSEWKAQVHKESAAEAKVAKAEHNATTNPNANEKKVHKELKKAEQINPGSTKNVNEKELLNTLEENKAKAKAPTEFATKQTVPEVPTTPVKPATPTVAPSGAGAVTGGAGTATKTGTKVATEEASHVAQTAAKSGSKFTKFLKKGGKIGAALLVIGGLFYGIKKLFGGGDDDKKTQANTPVQEQKDTPAPADKTKKPAKGSDGETAPAPVGSDSPTQPAKGEEKADDKAPADKKDPAKATPAPVSGDEKETKESDKADKPDKAEDKNRALPKNYTVKKGDNVWNIAKRRLQEMNGKKPTDREIMNYTNELLKLNKLEYEPDGYTVIIHKGDNIEYAA